MIIRGPSTFELGTDPNSRCFDPKDLDILYSRIKIYIDLKDIHIARVIFILENLLRV